MQRSALSNLHVLFISIVFATTLAPGCGSRDPASDGGDSNSSETGDGDGDSRTDTADGNESADADADAGDGDGDSGDGDGDGDFGDGDGDPGDGDGDSGDGDGDSGDGDSGDGDGDVDPGCGNGVLEPGETCDDGNLVPGDGCSQECSLEGLLLPCGNKIYECGDGVDNDDDGKVDTDDPDCISPCDDDEGSFETDLPGVNQDCKQDCFFDGDSGSGNDHCEWNLKCDPENPGAQIGCEYDPNFAMCGLQMPQSCLDFCVPLVPNGCDCFGCCQIGDDFYYLDSSPNCGIDNLDACQSCSFFDNCQNPCMPEECEVCFGQDPGDLPEECGGEPACPDNLTPCQGSNDCAVGEFCQTGCCIPIEVQ